MEENVTTAFYLPREYDQRIREIAAREMISSSAVVRLALRAFFANRKDVAARERVAPM